MIARDQRPLSHGPLPLEEADATPTAIAFATALAYDADASVVFEHRLLDIAELVHTVFADGHLDVGLAQPLLVQRRLADFAILDDHGGGRLDQCIEPRPAAAQKRDPAVEDQQDANDDHATGDRVVGAGDRRLKRVRDQQHEHEVKGRELTEFAFAEEAEADEKDDVDDDRPNNEMGPRNTQVEDLADVAHLRRQFLIPSPLLRGRVGSGP